MPSISTILNLGSLAYSIDNPLYESSIPNPIVGHDLFAAPFVYHNFSILVYPMIRIVLQYIRIKLISIFELRSILLSVTPS